MREARAKVSTIAAAFGEWLARWRRAAAANHLSDCPLVSVGPIIGLRRRAACREVVHVAAITRCTLSQDMLWAITCYFNPIGYRRRLSSYRVFRRRLNVPLVTVELGYHDVFELTDGGGMALYVRDRLLDRTREPLVDPAREP